MSSTYYNGKLDFSENDLLTKYDGKDLKTFHKNVTSVSSTQNQSKSKIVSKSGRDKVNLYDIVGKMEDIAIPGLEFSGVEHTLPKLCEDCTTDRILAKYEKKKLTDAKSKLVGILFECILQSVPSEKVKQIVHEDFKDDPEFLLKMALYCRKELNIRTVSNELLAIGATCFETKIFLKKYFKSCINTPNDWLEVAHSYMNINQTNKLPAQLRKVMCDKFEQFSIYQLGKYAGKKMNIQIKNKSYCLSLKSLIRKLHISKPSEQVMSLVGKHYPKDPEEFRLSQLPGSFDSSRAGKRMKLPVPDTWETQVSIHGNTAAVWEKLIDKKSLPYMAMIRNIRNLILSSMRKKYHDDILHNICNVDSVIKGKILPMQYFTAFKVLEDMINENEEDDELSRVDTKLIERYKSSLNKAVKISSQHNIPPIRGKLLVLANLADTQATVSKFGFKKGRDETTSLLVSLCYLAAENTEAYLLHKDNVVYKYENPKKMERSILTLAKSILNDKNDTETYGDINDPLIQKVEQIESFNTIILFGVDVKDEWIKNYVNAVNSSVNIYRIFYKQEEVSNATDLPNTRNMNGLTEQMIKFISEQSNGGTTQLIDRIDRKYQLADVDASSVSIQRDSTIAYPIDTLIPLNKETMKTKYTIFLSSTFTDMTEERDFLNTIVMPLLQKRLQKFNSMLTINWVDLRWGIPKSWGTNERLLDYCLDQSSKSDYFIGVYGNRYGWVPDKELVKKLEHKYPVLRNNKKYSVTRLEYMCANDSDCVRHLIIKDTSIHPTPSKKSKLSSSTEDQLNEFRNILLNNGDCNTPDKLFQFWKSGNDNRFKYRHMNDFQHLMNLLSDEIYEDIVKKHSGVTQSMIDKEDGKIVPNRQCVVHRRDMRYTLMHQYQLEIQENGLYQQIKSSNFAEEIQLLRQLLSSELVMNCQFFFNNLDRDSDANSRKNKSYHARLDGDLTERMRKNGTVPGGILLIHGNAYEGKSNISSSLFKSLCQKGENEDEFTLARHKEKRINYYWRFENVRDIDERNGQMTSFYNLLYDLIEFFIRHFYQQLIPNLKKRLKDLSCGVDTTLKYFWISDDIRSMLLIWDCILNTVTVPKNVHVTVFLDGIEKISDQSGISNMNWIPLLLPSNVSFVIVTMSKSPIHMSLKIRNNYVEHEIHSIPLVSKKKVIEQLFSQRGKVLDDSHINNEVQELCMKKESNKPFYLNMAISYLSNFGNFENIHKQIQKLPNTALELISHTLKRLAMEISEPILAVYLSFLMKAESGFQFEMLQEMMGIYFQVAEEANKIYFGRENVDQIVDYGSVRTDKCSFPPFPLILCNATSGLVEYTSCGRFKLKQIPGCIEILKSYTKMVNEFCIQKIISVCIHECFVRFRMDPFVYRELIHYMLLAEETNSVVNYLTSFKFITIKFSMDVADSLLNDYTECLRIFKDPDNIKKVKDFQKFVIKNYYDFLRNPSGIMQKGFYEPKDSFVTSIMRDILRKIFSCTSEISSDASSVSGVSDIMIQGVLALVPDEKYLKDLRTPQLECRVKEVISCCVVMQEKCKRKETSEDNELMDTDSEPAEKDKEDLMIIGCDSGMIMVFSLETLQLQHSLYHHFSRVNTLTMCGTRLISGDENGIIAVWNARTGALITQLQSQHDRAVTGTCWCPDIDGFCSVGLDSKMVFWNSMDYRVALVERQKSPINCIEVMKGHTIVAMGLWDGDVILYDVSARTRKAVIHNSVSVRSISSSLVSKGFFMISDINCRCTEINGNGETGQVVKVTDMTYNWGQYCCQAVGMSNSVRYLSDGSSFIMYPGLGAAVTKDALASSKLNSQNEEDYEDFIQGSAVTKLFNNQINRMTHRWEFSETISCMRACKTFVLFGFQNGTIIICNLPRESSSDVSEPLDIISLSRSEIDQIIANNSNSNEFFVGDFKGDIYMIDDILSTKNRKITRIHHQIHQNGIINCGKLQNNVLVSGSDDCNVIFTVFNPKLHEDDCKNQVLDTVEFNQIFSSPVISMSNKFVPNNAPYVAAGSKEAKIAIFNFKKRELLYTVTEPHDDWITGITMLDNHMITCSGAAEVINVWKIPVLGATGQPKLEKKTNTDAFINTICNDALCLSNGKLILLNQNHQFHNSTILRDFYSHKPLSVVDMQDCGLTGNKVLLDSNNRAHFYESKVNPNLNMKLDHRGSITGVCTMEDDRFCTVSQDGSIKLWDGLETIFSDIKPEYPDLQKASGSSNILEVLFVSWDEDDYLLIYEINGTLTINCLTEKSDKVTINLPEQFPTYFKTKTAKKQKQKYSNRKNLVKKYPCESLISENDQVLINFPASTFIYDFETKRCNAHTTSTSGPVKSYIDWEMKMNKKKVYTIDVSYFACKVIINNGDLTMRAEVTDTKTKLCQMSEMPLLCPVQSATIGKRTGYEYLPFMFLVYTNGMVQKVNIISFTE